MPRWDVSGRTVVVTGGTGGFARALAPALVSRGAKVALLDLDASAAEEAAASLGPSTTARGWRADVRDLASLEGVMAEVHEHFGRIDVAFANAGIGGTLDTLDGGSDASRWESMVDTNPNGVYRTFRAALPYVRESNGYLLAMSSMGGFVHNAMQGAYTATKAGVWAMCDTWRLELRHEGVAVGSLHPTFFRTPMTEEVIADAAGNRLFDGYTGLFKEIPVEVVVDRALHAIERRAAHTVAPKNLQLAAVAPGLFQKLVELGAYRGRRVPEAAALIKRETPARGGD